MSFLSPLFLVLLAPLSILFFKEHKKLFLATPLLILILIVLALSRPVLKKSLQDASIEAKDIIIALDVSFSMNADDVKPNRYLFAKKTIKRFLEQNPHQNIMLMVFTSNPLLLSPFTTDHRLIHIALESLNTQNILTKGTSLTKLFKKLKEMNVQNKELIIITDGGEATNLNKLHQLLSKLQTHTTFLALGSKQGVPIKTNQKNFLKDKKGNLVIARINPLLKSLAESCEARYLHYDGSTSKQVASKLTAFVNQKESLTHNIQKKQYHYEELYQIPLFIALLLFLLLHTKGVKYIIILFMLFGVEVEASFLDIYHLKNAYQLYQKGDFKETLQEVKKIKHPSLQSKLLFANTLYKQQRYKKAIVSYNAIASRSFEVKQQLYYNIGNAYAKQKLYAKAKVFYIKSLQLKEDKATAFNLKQILFLEDKKPPSLGIAHPKSQSSSRSKSQNQQEDEQNEKKNKEDAPSSGSGGGGESKITKEEKQNKNKLLLDPKAKPHPLGSKAYELINKGYIRETHPW